MSKTVRVTNRSSTMVDLGKTKLPVNESVEMKNSARLASLARMGRISIDEIETSEDTPSEEPTLKVNEEPDNVTPEPIASQAPGLIGNITTKEQLSTNPAKDSNTGSVGFNKGK